MNGETRPTSSQDIPVDDLFRHSQQLLSHPDLSSLPSSQISFKEKNGLIWKKLKTSALIQISLYQFKKLYRCGKITQAKKKAPGPEKVRNEMLKNGIKFLDTTICKLFNLILQSGFFPNTLWEGIITPILKSGNNGDPANYRGICLINRLGKLFLLS